MSAGDSVAEPLETAQITVCIRAGLMKRGDAALAAAGLTPSRAVRAPWELAESHVTEPESILKAIMPDRAHFCGGRAHCSIPGGGARHP